MWQEDNETFPGKCWIWALIRSSLFILPMSLSVKEIHSLCLYYITALFVILYCMRKLFLGLHCADNCIPISWKRWMTLQVLINCKYFTWLLSMGELWLFICSELHLILMLEGADVSTAPAHMHRYRWWRCASVCTVHSSRERWTWLGPLFSAVIRVLNHNIQKVQK